MLLAKAKAALGVRAFYPFQQRSTLAVLEGRHVFVVVPTGRGKSLCYQAPALELPGTTLVFSPLISLMTDQVNKLCAKGIRAARLGGDMSTDAVKAVMREVSTYKLLYVAPERLKSPEFMRALEKVDVSLIALDECHCLSAWRYFRPAYALLSQFISTNLRVPVIALTATADTEVEEDVVRTLKWQDYERIVASPVRDNIDFMCVKDTKVADIASFLEKVRKGIPALREGSTIIYCATRKSVEGVAEILNTQGTPAIAYHGGMQGEQRRRIQERFMSGTCPLIVATNAFGMGLDKSDIRIVFHYDIPSSLFEYVQEVGRGGRDGKPCMGILNFSSSGMNTRNFLLKLSNPPFWVYEKLWKILSRYGRVGQRITTTEHALQTQLGMSREFTGWAGAALRFIEGRGGVLVTPGLTRYTLPIRSLKTAVEYSRRLSCVKVDSRGGVVSVAISVTDDDPVDEMVKAGAVIFKPPQQDMVIRRRVEDLPLDEDHVHDKESRDRQKLRRITEFAEAPNKRAFVEALFLPED